MIDELWEQYGPQIERVAAQEFSDDRVAARAVCYHTLVRAARHFARGEEVPAGREQWHWLRGLAFGVGREIRAGALGANVPDGPPSSLLPPWLLAQVRARAAVDAEMIELMDAPGLGAIARALRRLKRGESGLAGIALLPLLSLLARRALDALAGTWSRTRRLEGTAGHVLVEPGIRFAHVAGALGLSEAAAVIAAAALLAATGPGGVLATSTENVLSAAPLAPLSQLDREAESLSSVITPMTPTKQVPVTAAEPRVAVAPSPEPRLSTNSDEIAGPPIHEEPHDGYDRHRAPSPEVEGDLTGDGESDFAISRPRIFVDCPPEDERGAITSVVCPVTGGDERI